MRALSGLGQHLSWDTPSGDKQLSSVHHKSRDFPPAEGPPSMRKSVVKSMFRDSNSSRMGRRHFFKEPIGVHAGEADWAFRSERFLGKSLGAFVFSAEGNILLHYVQWIKILLDDLTAINLSLLISAAALAVFFVADGSSNDDDDSSDGGLMQPVAAGA